LLETILVDPEKKFENFKVMRSITFGIALTILGIMIMAHAGSSLVTPKKVIEIRSAKIMIENTAIQWAPLVGFLFFSGGIGFAVYAKRVPLKFGF
jgi:hypothetical protein